MKPRVFEIITLLDAITLETTALHEELWELLDSKKTESTQHINVSVFKNTTRRLLMEFLRAPGHMLSHEKIRSDVMFDEEASDAAVRNTVKRARKEMKACYGCRYEIKTIFKRGYRLER